MTNTSLFVSAIFVLFFTFSQVTWSSPTPEAPPSDVKQEDWSKADLDENVTLTTPPTPPEIEPEEIPYYAHQQQLSLRLGQGSLISELTKPSLVLGFQYMAPKFASPKYEGGADLRDGGRGHIHFGKRYILKEKTYFRPSYKFALDHLLQSKNGLATLSRFENYFFRTGGAIDYTYDNPYSLRLEIELIANLDQQFLFFTVGVNRGW